MMGVNGKGAYATSDSSASQTTIAECISVRWGDARAETDVPRPSTTHMLNADHAPTHSTALSSLHHEGSRGGRQREAELRGHPQQIRDAVLNCKTQKDRAREWRDKNRQERTMQLEAMLFFHRRPEDNGADISHELSKKEAYWRRTST